MNGKILLLSQFHLALADISYVNVCKITNAILVKHIISGKKEL